MKPLDCMEIYEDAAFYDQEFSDRSREIPFFLKHAKATGGPILEIACGTGRLTLPIARANIEITGLDVSPPMLQLARRKAEAEKLAITWIQQDCRFINLEKKFALVFSATNAMQHLHDLDSANGFLTSVKKTLTLDGKLIIDVFNPNPAKLARSANVRYHHKTFFDEARNEIRVEASSEYDITSQILRFTLYYLQDEKLIRVKKVGMRCFFPEELAAICHFNKIEIVDRYGDYDETPFTHESPKQILICRVMR